MGISLSAVDRPPLKVVLQLTNMAVLRRVTFSFLVIRNDNSVQVVDMFRLAPVVFLSLADSLMHLSPL